MRENFLIAEDLLASQEGLCSMELASYLVCLMSTDIAIGYESMFLEQLG